MREKINEALKNSMRSQDKRRTATLRLISAALKDRDISVRSAGKDMVGDDEVLQILAKMIKQRDEAARIYEEASRLDLADQERSEITIISEFLPAQINDEEIETICRQVVAEIEAAGLRDMGRTMAILKERYPGQMDFGKASAIIKSLLQ